MQLHHEYGCAAADQKSVAARLGRQSTTVSPTVCPGCEPLTVGLPHRASAVGPGSAGRLLSTAGPAVNSRLSAPAASP